MLDVHLRSIAVIIGCFSAHAGSAQEATRIFAEDPENRFYGQYEVVDDHPFCARPDQLAFRVPLVADALEYQVYDSDTRSRAWVSGDEIVSQHQCFVQQGFGQNRIRIEVACSSDLPASFVDQIRDLDISVGLQANVTACLSPMGIEFVDSDWVVTVNGDGREDVHSSENIAQNDVLQAQDTTLAPPSLDFEYLSEGLGKNAWSWTLRDDPFVQNFGKKNVVRIEMSCIPVDRANGSATPLLLGFRGDFAIVDEPTQSCVGGDCPLFKETSSQWHLYAGRRCHSN